MQTKEQKKNTLLIGVGIAGGVLLGTGLATLGFKQFMKTDKAFDICRHEMMKKYPSCDLKIHKDGISIWGTNDITGAHKFLAGWKTEYPEVFRSVAVDIMKTTEVEARA